MSDVEPETARGNVTRAPYPLEAWFPNSALTLSFAVTGSDPKTGSVYPAANVSIVAGEGGQPWSGKVPNDQEIVAIVNGMYTMSVAWTPAGDVQIAADSEGVPTDTPLLVGTGFEVRVYDVANPNNLLAYVPNPVTVTWEDDISDVGSAQVTISTLDVPETVYQKDHIWRISWEGVERFAFIAEQIEDDQVTSDLVRTRTVAGKGIAQWLDKIKVYPTSLTSTNQPTRPFNNVSYAALYQALLFEAKERGAGAYITQYLWNGVHDSEGVGWTDTNQLQVQVGTSMLTLLQNFAAACPFDWHMDPRFALSLDKSMGTDKTKTIAIQPAGSIDQSQVTSDWTNLWDVVLVQDSNNNYSEQSDAPTITAYARREQFASSSTVVDSTGRADLGYQLLQGWKAPATQKVVSTSAPIAGRKPYVDFQLGDIITAEFIDGTVAPTRVIGIALSGGTDAAVQAEVILDFDFGNQPASTSTTPSGAYSGPVIVFADNGNTTWTITNQLAYPITLQLTTSGVAAVVCSSYIHGTASAACVIEADVLIAHTVIRTMRETLAAAGEYTWCPDFVIPALPQGVSTAQLRLSVTAGTFTIAPFELQHWYTGQGLLGGLQTGDASMSVTDPMSIPTLGIQDVDPTQLIMQTPIGLHKVDAVTPMYINIGDNDGGWIINRAYVPSDNDDSDRNSSGSWLNTSNDIEVGNDGTLNWDGQMRFLIPAPSFTPGTTVTHAFVTYINDENDNNCQITIRAEKVASPVALTSNADFTSRLSNLTTASVAWAVGSVIANTSYQTPDLSAIIQELIASFGSSITAINLFFLNNASPLNGKLLMRSKENSANTPPVLTVRFTT